MTRESSLIPGSMENWELRATIAFQKADVDVTGVRVSIVQSRGPYDMMCRRA